MPHLAQLNIARLIAPTDDPRIQDFMNNLDRVNGLGKRMLGFIWMMEGSNEPNTGNTELKLNNDPQFVSNLSVWESVAALKTFVFDTIHKQFYDRRTEWFEMTDKLNFVMWHIPEDTRPTMAQALGRLDHLNTHGESDYAFSWGYAAQQSQGAMP